MQLYLAQDTVLGKQTLGIFGHQEIQCTRSIRRILEAALGCFILPRIAVAVPLKTNLFRGLDVVLEHVKDGVVLF